MNIGCKLVSRGFNRGLTRAPRVSLLCNGTLYRYMSTQKFVDPTPSKEKGFSSILFSSFSIFLFTFSFYFFYFFIFLFFFFFKLILFIPEQLLKNIEEVRNKTKKVTWSIAKTFKFESAHCLVHHDGKCSREHGHSVCYYLLLFIYPFIHFV